MKQSNTLRLLTRPFKSMPTTVLRLNRRELPESIARDAALKTLLSFTTVITGIFFVLLLLSYFAAGNTYVIDRVIINFAAFIYLLMAYVLRGKGRHYAAAIMLITYYVAIASLAAWQWGINVAIATLLMSMTITLAGILLGARYSLYAAGLLCSVIILLQIATTTKLHVPDTSWQNGSPSLFGEAIGYCLLFIMLGVIAWIFGRQIERSLKQAREAEAALLEEKRLLAVRLKERTETLRAAQLKEMQQLYRFAELGQLSTALLHDLANHLTTLNLDIEDIELQQREEAIERAKQSMSYLDDLVAKVGKQLRDKGEVRSFNALYSLQTVGANLRPRFVAKQVILTITQQGTKTNLTLNGDPVRFSQMMTILITNALEAITDETPPESRRVRVQVRAQKTQIEILVSDWGAGVAEANRRKLFKPFQSTKEDGMGIGLFITKQITETHFKGSVSLDTAAQPTTFKVVLPRKDIRD